MGNTIEEQKFEEMIASTFVACNQRLNDWMHLEAIVTPLDDNPEARLGDVTGLLTRMHNDLTERIFIDIKDGHIRVCLNALIRMPQLIRRARDLDHYGDTMEELKSTWDRLNARLIVE